MIVLLDTGILSLVTNPSQSNLITFECNQWFKSLLRKRHFVFVPEIAYYEQRRELVLHNKLESIKRLDSFPEFERIGYAPITKEIIVKASQLWALARKIGQKTAKDAALDGDVILAAIAIIMAQENGLYVVIATTNVKHLERYTPAKSWRDIIV